MRFVATVCSVVVALIIVCMADGQDRDDANKDLQKMQGTWRVVSSQVGDEKAPEDEIRKRKIIVTGNTLIYQPSSGPPDKREGTIKLDPKMKALDWIVAFPESGRMLAIYDVKGDDLKIGFGNDGQVRPSRWVIGKDDVVWLLVLKRVKR